MFDLAAMIERLSRHWGPRPAGAYRVQVVKGRKVEDVGIGVLALTNDWNEGAWRLALLYRGDFDNPMTHSGQIQFMSLYVKCQAIARIPLGTGTIGDLLAFTPLQYAPEVLKMVATHSPNPFEDIYNRCVRLAELEKAHL